MIKQYQVTLVCNNGKYRPVSCIIKCEELDLINKEQKNALIEKGVQKICMIRYWSRSELTRFGYTKVKVREYNKTKIEIEANARYNTIKEAHYADGSWKRPRQKS